MGNFYDSNGKYKGRISDDGYMYNENGQYTGRMSEGGYLYDADGGYTGRVDNGYMYDGNGRYMGRVDGGNLYDNNGGYMGRMSGSVSKGGGGSGIPSIGGYDGGGSFEGAVAGAMMSFVAIFAGIVLIIACYYASANVIKNIFVSPDDDFGFSYQISIVIAFVVGCIVSKGKLSTNLITCSITFTILLVFISNVFYKTPIDLGTIVLAIFTFMLLFLAPCTIVSVVRKVVLKMKR